MGNVRWPHLVPLAVKLHSNAQLLASGRPIELVRQDEQAERVLRSFDSLTMASRPTTDFCSGAGAAESPGGAAPLDREFAKLAGRLTQDTDRSQLSVSGAEILDLLVDVGETGVCASCASAAGKKQEVCRWQADTVREDLSVLDKRGNCLKPVREIFDFAAMLASAQYAAVLKLPAPPSRVSLSTGHANECDPLIGIPLLGETSESPSASNHRTVRISFQIEQFAFADYLSLAYLLVHECVVHAHCGVGVDHADSSWSISFHDGWMDTVAYSILERELLSPRIAPSKHPVRLYAGEFLRQSGYMRARRYDASRGVAQVFEWLAGARALESFARLVAHGLYALDQCALDDAAKIQSATDAASLALNASKLDHRDRGKLVDVLNQRLSRSSVAAQQKMLREHPAAIDAVREYLLGPRNIEALAHKLLNL